MRNEMELWFTARAENERLARMAVAAFLIEADPTLEQIADIKTAVSEAVTNAVIHAYGILGTDSEDGSEDGGDAEKKERKKIRMRCAINGSDFTVAVEDDGCGIADIAKAMEPLYTTRPDLERSGMGFSFMEAFMDELKVESKVGEGTSVYMRKDLAYFGGSDGE